MVSSLPVFKKKAEMRKWMLANPEEGKAWAIEWFKQRKESKGLTYAPSQVELDSLVCPTMHYFNREFPEGYYVTMWNLGFQNRYVNDPMVFLPWFNGTEIIVDTREQNPLMIPTATRRDTLKVGDYRLEDKYDQDICIERKSLGDFCGTMSKGRERFERELDRAVDAGIYVVMLVESPIQAALTYDDKDHPLYYMRHVKASSIFIFHELREILAKYPLNFQVIFADGRIEAARLVKRIFQLGQQVRVIDLQFRLEIKEF